MSKKGIPNKRPDLREFLDAVFEKPDPVEVVQKLLSNRPSERLSIRLLEYRFRETVYVDRWAQRQQTQPLVGNHSLRLQLSFSTVLYFTGNRCEIGSQFERVSAWGESLKYKHTVKPNGLRKSVAWEVT